MNSLEGRGIDNSTTLVGKLEKNRVIGKDISRLSELTVRYYAIREREEAADGLESLLERRVLRLDLCFELAEFGA